MPAAPPDRSPRPPPQPGATRCPIVGLGASAGGLDAFQELFGLVPRDVGAAFVIVQHLPPEQPDDLAELLRNHTALPVRVAEEGAAAQANHVFLAPRGKALGISGGRFTVTAPDPAGREGPLDAFLRSLAEDQGELAVAVILSGLDGDGAEGARAVETAGGLALVQAPATAAHDAVPLAALAAGVEGPALPIAPLVRTLVRHVAAVAAVCQGPRTMSQGVTEIPPEIWSILRDSTGRDLSGYKPGTVARRLARRMQALDVDALSTYLARLRSDPDEPAALLQELLIGVTAFFRDGDAFQALERLVLPRLVAEARGRELRLWVPGCATGEEAYSIAMLARETCERAGQPARISLFATDLDARALEVARLGRYSRAACARLSPERLARFFVPRDGGFAVTKELRESCVFSLHHVTGDPPFSRLDLVSCRNVLIYLENELKRQVLPVFHYALRPGGVLLLGPSEGVGEHDDLFAPIDAKLRLFTRKDTPPRPPPRFRFSVRGPRPGAAAGPRPSPLKDGSMKTTVEQILLRELAPACAVVDRRGQVVHLSGRVGRYLEPPQGPPTHHLVDLAREGLRLEIRTALHKAVKEQREVVQEGVTARLEGGDALLDVLVRPLAEGSEHFMVVFREHGAPPPGAAPAADGAPDAAGQAALERVRGELRSTKEHLQTTIEELESSNAQLKVSNEELTTVNEELQSANEELQTSQEELQSLNEELETLNAELSGKVGQLDAAHADLQNLFQSTQLAALFLGRDLTIKKFTPAATQLFRVIEGDVGRPITDLAARFVDGDLVSEVSHVMRTLAPRERPVRLEGSGAWYVLRVLPYVTLDGAVDGVVITFADVTPLKRAEEAVRESERRFRELLEAIPHIVFTCNAEGFCDYVSRQTVEYSGLHAPEHMGFGWQQYVHPDDRERALGEWREAIARGLPFELELRLRRADGAYRWFIERAVPLRDEAGRLVKWFGSATDIDDRKRTEAALTASERRFRAAIDAFPGVFVLYDAQRRIRYINDPAGGLAARLRPADLLGKRDEELFPPEITHGYLPALERAFATGQAVTFECDFPAPLSSTAVVSYVPLRDEKGALDGMLAVTSDITDRKAMEQGLRDADRRKDEFLALLGHELRNPLAPLKNAVELLQRRGTEGEGARRTLAMMERQVGQLARLVDDLLDVERITRGKVQLRRAPVELGPLLRTLAGDLGPAFADAGIRLELVLPEGPVTVEGDRARLSQAVENLLQNALRFTNRGGRVELALRLAGARAEIAVRDDGVGMDEAFLARAFQPFSQAEGSLARAEGGLGLGLALVRGVAELHGGAARAASEGPGRGSEFVIALPLGAAGAPPPEPAATPFPARRRRVLVVDDNVDAAESLAELLQLDGHDVQVAADGASGIAAAVAFRPDVVLCDIGLPGDLDGYGVARALRASREVGDAYLVALTGYAGADHRKRAAEAGFDRHLAKPPPLDALAAILAAAPLRR